MVKIVVFSENQDNVRASFLQAANNDGSSSGEDNHGASGSHEKTEKEESSTEEKAKKTDGESNSDKQPSEESPYLIPDPPSELSEVTSESEYMARRPPYPLPLTASDSHISKTTDRRGGYDSSDENISHKISHTPGDSTYHIYEEIDSPTRSTTGQSSETEHIYEEIDSPTRSTTGQSSEDEHIYEEIPSPATSSTEQSHDDENIYEDVTPYHPPSVYSSSDVGAASESQQKDTRSKGKSSPPPPPLGSATQTTESDKGEHRKENPDSSISGYIYPGSVYKKEYETFPFIDGAKGNLIRYRGEHSDESHTSTDDEEGRNLKTDLNVNKTIKITDLDASSSDSDSSLKKGSTKSGGYDESIMDLASKIPLPSRDSESDTDIYDKHYKHLRKQRGAYMSADAAKSERTTPSDNELDTLKEKRSDTSEFTVSKSGKESPTLGTSRPGTPSGDESKHTYVHMGSSADLKETATLGSSRPGTPSGDESKHIYEHIGDSADLKETATLSTSRPGTPSGDESKHTYVHMGSSADLKETATLGSSRLGTPSGDESKHIYEHMGDSADLKETATSDASRPGTPSGDESKHTYENVDSSPDFKETATSDASRSSTPSGDENTHTYENISSSSSVDRTVPGEMGRPESSLKDKHETKSDLIERSEHMSSDKSDTEDSSDSAASGSKVRYGESSNIIPYEDGEQSDHRDSPDIYTSASSKPETERTTTSTADDATKMESAQTGPMFIDSESTLPGYDSGELGPIQSDQREERGRERSKTKESGIRRSIYAVKNFNKKKQHINKIERTIYTIMNESTKGAAGLKELYNNPDTKLIFTEALSNLKIKADELNFDDIKIISTETLDRIYIAMFKILTELHFYENEGFYSSLGIERNILKMSLRALKIKILRKLGVTYSRLPPIIKGTNQDDCPIPDIISSISTNELIYRLRIMFAQWLSTEELGYDKNFKKNTTLYVLCTGASLLLNQWKYYQHSLKFEDSNSNAVSTLIDELHTMHKKYNNNKAMIKSLKQIKRSGIFKQCIKLMRVSGSISTVPYSHENNKKAATSLIGSLGNILHAHINGNPMPIANKITSFFFFVKNNNSKIKTEKIISVCVLLHLVDILFRCTDQRNRPIIDVYLLQMHLLNMEGKPILERLSSLSFMRNNKIEMIQQICNANSESIENVISTKLLTLVSTVSHEVLLKQMEKNVLSEEMFKEEIEKNIDELEADIDKDEDELNSAIFEEL